MCRLSVVTHLYRLFQCLNGCLRPIPGLRGCTLARILGLEWRLQLDDRCGSPTSGAQMTTGRYVFTVAKQAISIAAVRTAKLGFPDSLPRLRALALGKDHLLSRNTLLPDETFRRTVDHVHRPQRTTFPLTVGTSAGYCEADPQALCGETESSNPWRQGCS